MANPTPASRDLNIEVDNDDIFDYEDMESVKAKTLPVILTVLTYAYDSYLDTAEKKYNRFKSKSIF